MSTTMIELSTSDLAGVQGGQNRPTTAEQTFNVAKNTFQMTRHPVRGVIGGTRRSWRESEKSVMKGDGYWTSVGKTFAGFFGWQF